VRRIFPGALQIHVSERRPAAIAVLDDLYYVDRRGDTFGPLRPQHDRDYPVFTGLGDRSDGQQRWALRRALHLLRRGLLEHGYTELAITGPHVMATGRLPPIHRDPFDRLLVAQAECEGALLMTADEVVACYPGPIRRVH